MFTGLMNGIEFRSAGDHSVKIMLSRLLEAPGNLERPQRTLPGPWLPFQSLSGCIAAMAS